MDRGKTLSREEALGIVRRYKRVISSRYHSEPRVVMYGSYAKGHATPDSDIDVAVIVPQLENHQSLGTISRSLGRCPQGQCTH